MTWHPGIKDCSDIVDELIQEYKDLRENQAYRIKVGVGSTKIAIDYSVAIAALERVKDCLKELQPPEV